MPIGAAKHDETSGPDKRFARQERYACPQKIKPADNVP
jgi:hypothetical protein